ncbi:insertion element IS401-family, uncharacterized 12.4 kDa protein (plasmid) [Cupriavidus metallidurans CH34]|uniref:Insertion element IS401-family, uncharacterized 12.4 kDa protein n=1 Tax=Cupriavidus metallidurans (strain ATCC 43123 / DSM 2839 / NBRC 102507 / CH34) TaxID=266264 RepID=Q1LFI2_CUPMC|nr:insertion element IS401-family, uncharacterized 12.4 kDa protein [Cupriavidus metallidurans CH34]
MAAPLLERMEPISEQTRFPPEIRQQRIEYPSPWAAVESIAPTIGCTSQTLLGWIKQVDLQSLADCSVGLSAPCRAISRSVSALRASQSRLARANAAGVDGNARGCAA